MAAYPNYGISDRIHDFFRFMDEEDYRNAYCIALELRDYGSSHPQKMKSTLRYHFGRVFYKTEGHLKLYRLITLAVNYGTLNPKEITKIKRVNKKKFDELLGIKSKPLAKGE